MGLLHEKVAVITGGNSGIGYATAKEMKQEGATVIITGRNEEKVRIAANELGVGFVVADVSNVADIETMAQTIAKEYSKIDILFNNAGVFFPSPLEGLTEEAYNHQMDINFKGAIFTLSKLLPLLNDGAAVVNLASIVANIGFAGSAMYAASKAAMNALTRTAAIDLASRKIRVNSVNPGPISTPIFSKVGMTEEQLQGMAQALQESVPMGRFGEPAEVAKLVTFLASDNASYITGQEYVVDGGLSITST